MHIRKKKLRARLLDEAIHRLPLELYYGILRSIFACFLVRAVARITNCSIYRQCFVYRHGLYCVRHLSARRLGSIGCH